MENSTSNVVRQIREIAEEEGMDLQSFSSDWAFRLTASGKSVFIVGYQFPLNRASAKEICQDKVLTYEVLSSAEIPAAECRFLPDTDLMVYTGMPSALSLSEAALLEYRKAVVKDNFGTGGNEVFLVEAKEQLPDILSHILKRSTAACISPYYEIQEEYRAVVLDGEVQLVLRKERMSVIGDGIHTAEELAGSDSGKAAFLRKIPEDRLKQIPAAGEKLYLNWKHNLGQGATGIPLTDGEIRRAVSSLAIRTAECTGVRFASVDIISTEQGLMVLEINGGVMLEHFSGQSDETYALAKEIYRKAILLSFS